MVPIVLDTARKVRAFHLVPLPPGGEEKDVQPDVFTLAPPSTGRVTPVMKFASSEARNRAALATSQPVPIFLRKGTWASRIASISARGFLNSRARVSTAIGVFIRPGRMTLARIPYCAFW